MKTKLLLSACFMLLLSVHFTSDAQDQREYRFIYHVVEEYQFGGLIGMIDPLNLDAPVEYLEVPVEEEWEYPSLMRVSPNGEWIVFSSSLDGQTSRSRQFVRLWNMI
ncbi:MAG: hypothetical protein H7Y09_02805, partial [Chitinophagaceae bacterium]|nr:hypothetical protein [Anaerolineae bacterium]